MKVQVEGTIYIESDSRQYILKDYTRKLDKDEKELYNTLGYYMTLSGVLKRLLQMEIQASTAATLKELLSDLNRIDEKMSGLKERAIQAQDEEEAEENEQ